MKSFSILILILFSSTTLAATKYLAPTDQLPREFIYLTETLQELQLKDPSKIQENDNKFKQLEKKLQQLTKEELFFILKSEIYKTTLQFRPSPNLKDRFYEKKILEEINKKLSEVELKSFSHWLILAIIKDVKNIHDSREYSTYMVERKRGAISTAASKKIQKRFNFLLPWLQSFMTEDPKLFEYGLVPIMNKSISKIEEKVDYLLSLSLSTEKRGLDPKIFFKEQVLELNKEGEVKTVEDILDPLLSKEDNENLPIPVDDWIEEEDELSRGLEAIVSPEKDYSPPKQLPKPVEEW